MADFDADAARERYAEEETEELVKIAYLNTDRYVVDAVALAKAELARRGIKGYEDQRVENSVRTIQQEYEARRKVENLSLGAGYKVVCFIFADIIAAIIAIVHYQSGKRRAAREAWKWIGYGWLFRVAIFLVIMLAQWS